MSNYRVGVDIGGTFTDIIVLGGTDGVFDRLFVGKILTTPADPSIGAMSGLVHSLQKMMVSPTEVSEIVHGTTLVANAIIERKGAKTGLLVTKGFLDVLDTPELRYDLYNLFFDRPDPLVPRYLRREIDERIDSNGRVVTSLDPDEVERAVRELVDQGVNSIVVCFLHSYENSTHEQAAKQLITSRFPDTWLSVSSEVLPEIREYNRMSTTAGNAYVKPLMASYLERLLESLEDLQFDGAFHMMLSSGGITSTDVAREYPIRLIESGPAAGALAATFIGDLVGHRDVLSFDMGGTTAKMCVVTDSKPTRSNEFEAARLHRFKPGSGLIIQTPVLRLLEIGAGGGSIAHIDEMGLLKVGPESSGADPGPACYGQGGMQPTVTDSDLILGYLDPDWFLGGEMALDAAAAERAIDEYIAKPLGVSCLEAAAGVSEVVNHNMATATRVHIAEHGRDPRNYAMVVFGGAGPVHGARVAELLGLSRMICPLASGALSALGLLVAPTAFEFSRTYICRLEQIDWERLQNLYQEMESEGREIMTNLGVPPHQITMTRSADMRYAGQGFSVTVPILEGLLSSGWEEAILQAFYEAYRARYQQAPTNVPVEAINWHLAISGPRPTVNLQLSESQRRVEGTVQKGTRSIYVPSLKQMVEARVLNWYALKSGSQFSGPAVVEARESTAIIGPGSQATVDEYMSLIVDLPLVKN